MNHTTDPMTDTTPGSTPRRPARRWGRAVAAAALAVAAALLLQGCGNWLGTDWEDNEYEHSHRDRGDR